MSRLLLCTGALLTPILVLTLNSTLVGFISDAEANNLITEASPLEAQSETLDKADIESVDCLFPGQIRPLGPTTYLVPARHIRTTKRDCETRGGRVVTLREPEGKKPSNEPAKGVDHVSP